MNTATHDLAVLRGAENKDVSTPAIFWPIGLVLFAAFLLFFNAGDGFT